jgi:PadR family transcriptional regulator PadR
MTSSDDPVPGVFEEQVLVAVVRCGDDAYGMTVRRELRDRTGRDVSIGAVYATLDRMESKGWVRSHYATETGALGGGRRRYFALEDAGARALLEVRRVRDRLWQGVDPETILPEG